VASINDVFDALNDIKGKLDTVHADGTNTAVKLSTTNTRLSTIDQSVNGVGNRLEARLVEVVDRQEQTNAVLLHQTLQLEAVICALNAISSAVCTLVNIGATDSRTLSALAESNRVATDIARTANPSAALDLDRRDAATAALKACCPDEPETPVCLLDPCADPGQFKQAGDHKIG
jgi:hypothetical protein